MFFIFSSRRVLRKEGPVAEPQLLARHHAPPHPLPAELLLPHPPHHITQYLQPPRLQPLHPLQNSILLQQPTSWKKIFIVAIECLGALCLAQIHWQTAFPTQEVSPPACMSPPSLRLSAYSTVELNPGRSREAESSSTWRSLIKQAEVEQLQVAGMLQQDGKTSLPAIASLGRRERHPIDLSSPLWRCLGSQCMGSRLGFNVEPKCPFTLKQGHGPPQKQETATPPPPSTRHLLLLPVPAALKGNLPPMFQLFSPSPLQREPVPNPVLLTQRPRRAKAPSHLLLLCPQIQTLRHQHLPSCPPLPLHP